jgi:hypothetical protein
MRNKQYSSEFHVDERARPNEGLAFRRDLEERAAEKPLPRRVTLPEETPSWGVTPAPMVESNEGGTTIDELGRETSTFGDTTIIWRDV